jgi:hypothetical protein
MKNAIAVLALLSVFLALPVLAQNAPLPTQTFAFTDSAVSLPGIKGTFVGNDAGVTFSPTPNFDLAEHNIVSSDAKLSAFMGGVNYRFPVLSLGLNNAMPDVSGFRLLFGLSAAAGIDRVKDDAGNVAQHYAFLAKATFSYAMGSTGAWQMGANVGMARFPGFAKGWTPVVEVGPSFQF